MTTPTATATHLAAAFPWHPVAGPALLILSLAAITLGYLAACWYWPFIACGRCGGTGKKRSPLNRRTFALCRRCDGTGRRLRIGRHLLNHLRGVRRNARNAADDKGTKR